MEAYVKVLLLEDSLEDAEIVERVLQKENPLIQFKLVMTREDYVQALNDFHPDVILSDNSMPQFDASEALEILLGFSIKIPFILVTGTVSEEFAAGIIKAGADDYILKDRMGRLPAAIKAAVTKKKAEKERMDTRRKLAKSEERYRTLYERNHTGVYQTNLKGIILSCNNAFAQMLGYNSPAELQQINAEDLYFSGSERESLISELHNQNQITNFELVLRHKNGTAVNVLENISLLVDPETGEEIIEGVMLDISRQKKGDEERNRLSSIIEATSDFVGVADINRHIIFLNKAGRKISGYSESENLFFKLVDDFVPSHVNKIITDEGIPTAIKEGKWTGEIAVLKKDGSEIPVSAVLLVLNSPDGKPEYFATIARDITEIKKAEQQKEFDSNNLAALINNTHDLMWSIDRNFKLLTCNISFSDAIKTNSGRPIQKGDNVLRTSFSPKQLEQFRGFYERAFAGESFTEIQHNKDIWSEISLYPIYNNKFIIGTACFSHDITKQKKADESLKKFSLEKEALAERMSTILNTLPANIALLDEQGIIIDVNDAWRNFADTNGFIGNNYAIGDNYIKVTETVTGAEKEDGKIVAAGIRDVLNKLIESFEYEYPCHSPVEERWFRMIVTPLLEKGKGGVVVMHLNITEQKKSAAALEATLKELSDYKIALDESSIVSITDQKGVITYVNANFCAISKYSREELLGNDHRMVNSSFHDKAFIKKLWVTISAGKIWRNEIRNIAKDGEMYWLDTTIVPFLNDKGKPIQYVAINKDITETKLIEQELLNQKVQEQKRITRAMIIAQEKERNHLGEELHDNINQILAGTKLYLGMAGMDNPTFKELIKYPIELIDSSIQEIRLLCHKLVTPLKNLDLDQMIRDLLDGFSQNTKIKTGFNYSLATLLLTDDLKLNIYRIIQEQINNIVKYAKAKNVNISITEKDRILAIIVIDNGIGFNVNSKRKGIGISNMIHRIESYNGELEIISSPGNGCTIDIKIPC